MASIILFDGQCHFCNKNVQFIIKRDPQARFKFASLQSGIGRTLLQTYDVPTSENSLILLENNCFYSKSTAALRISKRLKGLWKIMYICILIPKPLRDGAYRLIAKNRKKWFKQEACPLYTKEDEKRFL